MYISQYHFTVRYVCAVVLKVALDLTVVIVHLTHIQTPEATIHVFCAVVRTMAHILELCLSTIYQVINRVLFDK